MRERKNTNFRYSSIISFTIAVVVVVIAGVAFIPQVKANTDGGDNVGGWLWDVHSDYQVVGGEDSSVGWISLDSSNQDLPSANAGDYGIKFPTDCSDSRVTCESPDDSTKPGVKDYITETQAAPSSYAWNGGETGGPRLGWIRFAGHSDNPLTLNNPSPDSTVSPDLQTSDGSTLSGWARVCSVFSSGCSGSLASNIFRGGFDGWIAINSSSTGVSDDDFGPTRRYNRFNGYAWGGSGGSGAFNDAVVGWLHFGNDGKKYNNGKRYNYNVSLQSNGSGLQGGEHALVKNSSNGDFTESNKLWTDSKYLGFRLEIPGARFPALNQFRPVNATTDETGTQLNWSLVNRDGTEVSYYETQNEWAGVRWDSSTNSFKAAAGETLSEDTRIPADITGLNIQPAIGPSYDTPDLDTTSCSYDPSSGIRTCEYKLRAVNRFGDHGNTVKTDVEVQFGGDISDPPTASGQLEAEAFPTAVDRNTNSRAIATVYYNDNQEVLDGRNCDSTGCDPNSDEDDTWTIAERYSDELNATRVTVGNQQTASGSSYDRKYTIEWDLDFSNAPFGRYEPAVSVEIKNADDGSTERVSAPLTGSNEAIVNYRDRNIKEVEP